MHAHTQEMKQGTLTGQPRAGCLLPQGETLTTVGQLPTPNDDTTPDKGHTNQEQLPTVIITLNSTPFFAASQLLGTAQRQTHRHAAALFTTPSQNLRSPPATPDQRSNKTVRRQPRSSFLFDTPPPNKFELGSPPLTLDFLPRTNKGNSQPPTPHPPDQPEQLPAYQPPPPHPVPTRPNINIPAPTPDKQGQNATSQPPAPDH